MDLEVINLKADSKEVEQSTKAVQSLDTAIGKISSTVKKAQGDIKGLNSELKNLDKVSDPLSKMNKSVADLSKILGSSSSVIKTMTSALKTLNTVASNSNMSAIAKSMAEIKKQSDGFKTSVSGVKQFNDAISKQISLLERVVELTKQQQSQLSRVVGGASKSGTDSISKQIEQQERLASVTQKSATARSNAEQRIQRDLEKTLFATEKLNQGFGTASANTIYRYKKDLELLGVAADQAEKQIMQLENALLMKQAAAGKRNPLNDIKNGIKETREEVNHLARAVSVQMGDVAVSLAGGMNPFLVMIQQGDQLRFAVEQATASGQKLDGVMKGALTSMAASFVNVGKIFSSFVVDSFNTLGRSITSITMAMIPFSGELAKMNNAFELSAALGNKHAQMFLNLRSAVNFVVGAMGSFIALVGVTMVAALVKADSQQSKLAVSLNQYGAALGITAEKAREMALASEQSTSSVVNAIAALSKAGFSSGEQLQAVAEAVARQNKIMGTSVEEAAGKYASLKKDPLNTLLELQAQTGNVDRAILDTVQSLVEQGNTYEATKVAIDAYAAASNRTANQIEADLGSVASAMIALKEQWADMFKNIESFAILAAQNILYVVRGIGQELGGIAAQVTSFFSEGFAGAGRVRDMMVRNAEESRLQIDLQNNKITGGQGSDVLNQYAKDIESAAKEVEKLNKLVKDTGAGVGSLEVTRLSEAEGKLKSLTTRYSELAAIVTNGAAKSRDITVQEQQAAAELAQIRTENASAIDAARTKEQKYLQDLLKLQMAYSKAGSDPKLMADLSAAMDKLTTDYQKSLETKASTSEKYTNRIQERIRDLAIEVNGEWAAMFASQEQLTKGQKLWLDILDDPVFKNLPAREKEIISAKVEQIIQEEKQIKAGQRRLEIYKEQYALDLKRMELQEQYDETNASSLRTIEEEANLLKLRESLLGKTEEEAKKIQREYDKNAKIAAIENKYIAERKKLLKDYNDLLISGDDPKKAFEVYNKAMKESIDRQGKELQNVHSEVAVVAAEEYEARFKEIQGTVSDIIATALFEGGDAGAKKLKDVLKNAFRKFTIDVIINPISQGITNSVMGGISSLLGLGGGGSGGGVLDLAQNLYSMYNYGSNALSYATAISNWAVGGGGVGTGGQIGAEVWEAGQMLQAAEFEAAAGAAGSGTGAVAWGAVAAIAVAWINAIFEEMARPDPRASYMMAAPGGPNDVLENWEDRVFVEGPFGKIGMHSYSKDIKAYDPAYLQQFEALARQDTLLAQYLNEVEIKAVQDRMDGWISAHEDRRDTIGALNSRLLAIAEGIGGEQYQDIWDWYYQAEEKIVVDYITERFSKIGVMTDLQDDRLKSAIDTYVKSQGNDYKELENLYGELVQSNIDQMNAITEGTLESFTTELNRTFDLSLNRGQHVKTEDLYKYILDVIRVDDLQEVLAKIGQDIDKSGALDWMKEAQTTQKVKNEFGVEVEQAVDGFSVISAALNNLWATLYATPVDAVNLKIEALAKQLNSLGIENIPTNIIQLRELAKSIDISTEAGRNLLLSLNDITPVIVELQNAILSIIGVTRDSIAGIITGGLVGDSTAQEVTSALNQSIVKGIANAMSSEVSGMITDIMIGQIINPAIEAMLLGGEISSAINTAQMDAAIAEIEKKAMALEAVFASEAVQSSFASLRSVMERIGLAVGKTGQKLSEVAGSDVQDSLTEIIDLQRQRYQAEKDAIQEQIRDAQSLLNAAKSLKKFAEDFRMRTSSADNPAKLNILGARYREQLALAAGGDVQAFSDVQNTASKYIDMFRNRASSAIEYNREVARMASEMNTVATETIDKTQALIDMLNARLATIEDLLSSLGATGKNILYTSEQQLLLSKSSYANDQKIVVELTNLNSNLQTKPTSVDKINSSGNVDPNIFMPSNPEYAQDWSLRYYEIQNLRGGLWTNYNNAKNEAEREQALIEFQKTQAYYEELMRYDRESWVPGAIPVPQFADGGMYPGGLALVGEEGPELINFKNSGMVYTAPQTASILNGAGNSELIEALIEEVIMLRAETRATAQHTAKTFRLLDRAASEDDAFKVRIVADETAP